MRHLIVRPVVTRLVVAMTIGVSISAVASPQPSAGSARIIGQSLRLTDRRPVFYAVRTDGSAGAYVVRVDARNVAVLRQRIAVDFEAASIPDALAVIGEQSGLRFAYDRTAVPADARVTLRAQDITVAAALTQVLLDTRVDVELKSSGVASLVPRGARPADASAVGRLTGRVSDTQTQRPIPYATVQVEGTGRGATATDSGTYKIGNVPEGTHTVSVRALGYTPIRQSVTVVAGQVTEMDFALTKSPSPLERVVVTGTVAPTEVKAIPTPITVITSDEIAQQRFTRVDQLLRQYVPGLIDPEDGSSTEETIMSVRGSTTLVGGTTTMKIYIDGVETADREFSAVDPASVDHIEILRGPEAAAIYGSDAIGGVIQVFTKHGTNSPPELDASAAVGPVQSQFVSRPAVQQQYQASVHGGDPTTSYNVGAGFSRTGEWTPQYELSVPSAYGSLRFANGPVTLALSGRYQEQDYPVTNDPRAVATGYILFSKPRFINAQSREETYGATLKYAPTSWWQQNLTIGVDYFFAGEASSRPQLTSPSDTLLTVAAGDERKASFAYNTSATARLTSALSGILTLGIDHAAYSDNVNFALAGNVTGTIATPSDQPPFVLRSPVTNTGYFAQAQVDLNEVLFLTGGLRAENNSDFGNGIGTPLSPRAGVSFVHGLGGVTLKLRGSYGESIQPPEPGLKDAELTSFSDVLANPLLRPQRQVGGDGGFDLVFGDRASIGVTYYNQIARDLIQGVVIDANANPQVTQFQNVARVKNTGVEIEARAGVRRVTVNGQFAVTNSRVQDVGPNYTGDLLVGDQVMQVPRYTGGAALTIEVLPGTDLSAGFNYVGSQTNYDFLAEFRCFAGTGPCQATLRGYHIVYPAYAKANVSITEQITHKVSGFVTVRNLTNSNADELNNVQATRGRTTLVGVHVTQVL
jgi:outer membrane receptor protein involved in Fe transport